MVPRFRSVPWQTLSPVLAAQLTYWVELTGITDLSVMFFEVLHTCALPESVLITQHGARRKALAFVFELEHGQAGVLLNAMMGRGLPDWFNATVTGALRIPPGFAALIAAGTWRFLGLPVFNDSDPSIKRVYGWLLHLEVFDLDEVALLAHSPAEHN